MSGPCIATEEFITYGHSTLGRGSQLLWFSRLHRTSHAKRRSRRNSTTKFSLTYSPSSSPEFCANRTKRRNNTPNFSPTTPSNFISCREQMLAVAPRPFVVSVTAFSIGVMTFFGVTALNPSTEDSRAFRDENLRTAIAASLVFTYLFIVCFTAFVRSAA